MVLDDDTCAASEPLRVPSLAVQINIVVDCRKSDCMFKGKFSWDNFNLHGEQTTGITPQR